MLIPRPEDVLHKAWLYRLLIAFADNGELMRVLRFKGGTCAAMAGYLNRFSVDLDFDFIGSKNEVVAIRKLIEYCGSKLNLKIQDSSKKGIQYFFKYSAKKDQRNTLKIDAVFPVPASNEYSPLFFPDIDRTLVCQTVETMFANKLVSTIDRYEKYASVAGRDIYDIHCFFLQGFKYGNRIIEERRGVKVREFFEELIGFIKKHITQTVIDQDLNMLLPQAEFKKIRGILVREVLMFLGDEQKRI